MTKFGVSVRFNLFFLDQNTDHGTSVIISKTGFNTLTINISPSFQTDKETFCLSEMLSHSLYMTEFLTCSSLLNNVSDGLDSLLLSKLKLIHSHLVHAQNCWTRTILNKHQTTQYKQTSVAIIWSRSPIMFEFLFVIPECVVGQDFQSKMGQWQITIN